MIRSISQKFNLFYNKVTILKAQDQDQSNLSLLPPPPTWSRILIWSLGSGATFLLIWSMVVKVDERVIFNGEITTSSPEVSISIQDSGIIKDIYTKPHSAINENDLILIFDDNESSVQLKSIAQRIKLTNLRKISDQKLYQLKEKRLKEQISLDKELLNRMEQLLIVGAIEKTQVLKQRSELSQGLIQVSSLREESQKSEYQLEQLLEELKVSEMELKEKLNRFQIRSPVTGFVQQMKYQTIGERVQRGEVILTIIPKKDLIARVSIPSNLKGPVEINSPATISVDAFPEGEYGSIEAVVSSISPMTINSNNNSKSPVKLYNADLKLIESSNPDLFNLDKLRPGMFVSAQMVLRDKPVITTVFKVLEKVFDPLTEQR